jgi:hypothetical protein
MMNDRTVDSNIQRVLGWMKPLMISLRDKASGNQSETVVAKQRGGKQERNRHREKDVRREDERYVDLGYK